MTYATIEAVAFDCYGTLINFGDDAYIDAYGTICREQGLPLTGEVLYEKWMEIWRRLVNDGRLVATTDSVPGPNTPGPLSETVEIPPHPQHHTPSSTRIRPVDGPVPPFRSYREEWTEHFELCFEELGVEGDAVAGHEHLRSMLAVAPAFEEARRTVETIGRKMPIAMMSNADDDFLFPALSKNVLSFPVTLSSEEARAYKPHRSIFQLLSERMGVAPEGILYVGDSLLADVTGSRNAGMQAAWINRSADSKGASDWASIKRDLAEPHYEVSRLDALIEVVGIR